MNMTGFMDKQKIQYTASTKRPLSMDKRLF